MSQRVFEILHTSSAIFDDQGGFESFDSEPHGQSAGDQPSRVSLAVLLLAGLYFDSSVALWQNVYKDAQVRFDGPNCEAVHDWVLTNRRGFPWEGANAPHALHGADGCPPPLAKQLKEPKEAIMFRRLEPSKEADAVEKEDSQCSWKAVVHVPTGRLKCKPQSFTKGCALSLQATCGLILYYSYNYWEMHLQINRLVANGSILCCHQAKVFCPPGRGFELIKECFQIRRLLKFSVVGAMFGCGAVFSFLAQDALSPGSYALYAQSGVVIVPIMWRILFRQPLPVLTWVHICIITLGILAYRISEIDLDHMFDGIGLMWVALKVLMAGLGSVVAELLLKQDTSLPFTVQVACILPSKALACLLTIWLIPGPDMEWPNHLPDRPGGFFHDWSMWTWVIVFHNLGDTILSAAVAKQFDSVAKAICGVVGIIFPTWVVSYLCGWEDLVLKSSAGQLKMTGGVVVIVGSFAYVLGRAQNNELRKSQDEVARLSQRSGVVELT